MKRRIGICIAFVYLVCCKATTNIALGKQSRQSTTYKDKDPAKTYIPGPNMAVNGEFKEFGDLGEFQCAHTKWANDSWWAVDLGNVFKVSNILVYGRTDCCTNHLKDFDVEVIMQPECSCDTWATFHRGRTINCHYQLAGTTFLNITCPNNTIGRFVRIQTRSYNTVVLCEVEVFGDLFSNTAAATRNTFAAYGYHSKSYDGSIITKTVAKSKLICVMFCLLTTECCAAEFTINTGECSLHSKTDGLEETTNTLVDNPSKITFLV